MADGYLDAKITIRSQVSVLVKIKTKLEKNQSRISLFRESVFGPWLDLHVPSSHAYDNHLLNRVLHHQVYIPKLLDHCPPISFIMGDNVLQFGRWEFLLITGLLFGPLPELAVVEETPLGLRLFPDKKLEKKFTVYAYELLELLENDTQFDALSNEDAVRVCLLIVADVIFNGRGSWYVVPNHLFQLVENFTDWNAYPWGEFLWRSLYVGLANAVPKCREAYYRKKEKSKTSDSVIPTYTLSGFVWAFKIWILESYPNSSSWWKKDSSKIPRGICWSHGKRFQKCHHDLLCGSGSNPILKLVATDEERLQPWFVRSNEYLVELTCIQSQADVADAVVDGGERRNISAVEANAVVDGGERRNIFAELAAVKSLVKGLNFNVINEVIQRITNIEEYLNIRPQGASTSIHETSEVGATVSDHFASKVANNPSPVHDSSEVQVQRCSTSIPETSEVRANVCDHFVSKDANNPTPVHDNFHVHTRVDDEWKDVHPHVDEDLASKDAKESIPFENEFQNPSPKTVDQKNEEDGKLHYLDASAYPSSMSQLEYSYIGVDYYPAVAHMQVDNASDIRLPKLPDHFSQSSIDPKNFSDDFLHTVFPKLKKPHVEFDSVPAVQESKADGPALDKYDNNFDQLEDEVFRIPDNTAHGHVYGNRELEGVYTDTYDNGLEKLNEAILVMEDQNGGEYKDVGDRIGNDSDKIAVAKIDREAEEARNAYFLKSLNNPGQEVVDRDPEETFTSLKRKRKSVKDVMAPLPGQPKKKRGRRKFTKKKTIEFQPDVQQKRTKDVGKSLKDPYVKLPPTTPPVAKRRSKRLNKVISFPHFNEVEPWVENLSRPAGFLSNKKGVKNVVKPECMGDFLEKGKNAAYTFPWGKSDTVVRGKFWRALLAYGRGHKGGWLGDEHLDVWVDLMWHFRPDNADWAMAGPFFSATLLEGRVRAGYANGKLYPVPWTSVDKVYFPVNVPSDHWFLAQLEISTGVVTIYDSLGTPDPETRKDNLKMRATFEKMLPKYLKSCKVFDAKSISSSNYKVTFRVADNIPRQGDVYGDCGVWVCIFLHRLANNLSMSVDDPLQVALAYREHMVRYFWKYKVPVNSDVE